MKIVNKLRVALRTSKAKYEATEASYPPLPCASMVEIRGNDGQMGILCLGKAVGMRDPQASGCGGVGAL
jgi:hypothetical protein